MAFGTEWRASEKVVLPAEMPHVQGDRTALVEVAQDMISGFFSSSSNPAVATRMMSLPFASSQTSQLSPRLPFSDGNQKTFICCDFFCIPLLFSPAPSSFVCFKECSRRGNAAEGGGLSSMCKLSHMTAPGAAGAQTRLKKNTGIFNFLVWSWEMKSHHERSLPGAARRWECQAQWETTEKYWSSIFIRKEFSSPALAAPGTKLVYKKRSPGLSWQDSD